MKNRKLKTIIYTLPQCRHLIDHRIERCEYAQLEGDMDYLEFYQNDKRSYVFVFGGGDMLVSHNSYHYACKAARKAKVAVVLKGIDTYSVDLSEWC